MNDQLLCVGVPVFLHICLFACLSFYLYTCLSVDLPLFLSLTSRSNTMLRRLFLVFVVRRRCF